VSVTSRAARRHRRGEAEDLNITAFMNLMVILVPFLLITAVFSRLTILELNLPSSTQAVPEVEQVINLEVVVRADTIQVADRGTGLLKAFPKADGQHDLEGLAKYLYEEVKPRFPELTDVTILLEPDVPYDVVVQVMDAVRVHSEIQGTELLQVELFPDISIGDAPT